MIFWMIFMTKYAYEYGCVGDIINNDKCVWLGMKSLTNQNHSQSVSQCMFACVICLQVITPLPSHIPQCKALYDFKMTNDEERDCLTFNKVKKLTRFVLPTIVLLLVTTTGSC